MRKIISENESKESPYNLDNSLGKSPVNVREINSLAEDSKDNIHKNERSIKRKKKAKSKKKDTEN